MSLHLQILQIVYGYLWEGRLVVKYTSKLCFFDSFTFFCCANCKIGIELDLERAIIVYA